MTQTSHTAFAAQRSRYWLPHVLSATARLRAFSYGYRVHPHLYRSEFTKKREVGWFSPDGLTRQHVGGTTAERLHATRDDGLITVIYRRAEEKAPRVYLAENLAFAR